MKKKLFLFALISVLVLTGCGQPKKKEIPATVSSLTYENTYVYRNESQNVFDVFFLYDEKIEEYELVKLHGDYFENAELTIVETQLDNKTFDQYVYAAKVKFDLKDVKILSKMSLLINGKEEVIDIKLKAQLLKESAQDLEIAYRSEEDKHYQFVVSRGDNINITNATLLSQDNIKFSIDYTQLDYTSPEELEAVSSEDLISIFDVTPITGTDDVFFDVSYRYLKEPVISRMYLERLFLINYKMDDKDYYTYIPLNDEVPEDVLVSELAKLAQN